MYIVLFVHQVHGRQQSESPSVAAVSMSLFPVPISVMIAVTTAAILVPAFVSAVLASWTVIRAGTIPARQHP